MLDDSFQFGGRNIFSNQCVCHLISNFTKGSFMNIFKKILRQYRNFFGHVQSIVWCKTLCHGLFQIDFKGWIICTIKFHLRNVEVLPERTPSEESEVLRFCYSEIRAPT